MKLKYLAYTFATIGIIITIVILSADDKKARRDERTKETNDREAQVERIAEKASEAISRETNHLTSIFTLQRDNKELREERQKNWLKILDLESIADQQQKRAEFFCQVAARSENEASLQRILVKQLQGELDKSQTTDLKYWKDRYFKLLYEPRIKTPRLP
jgi:hypothetical protein